MTGVYIWLYTFEACNCVLSNTEQLKYSNSTVKPPGELGDTLPF